MKCNDMSRWENRFRLVYVKGSIISIATKKETYDVAVFAAVPQSIVTPA